MKLEQVENEVRATQARKPHKLPAAWYDDAAIERMSDWINRFVPVDERSTFRYGVFEAS